MRRRNTRTAKGLGLVLAGLAILAFALPAPLAAQAVSGTILGVVKDTSGAVVPGATVTLVNTGTGLTRTVVSDAKGDYSAPSLPTGTYTVSAEMSGFKKVSLTSVHLGVDQKVKIDLKLDLGEMTESIEIQAETPLVQTSSSDLSVTVEGKTIESLPLNGRNFVSLTRTIPGVTRGSIPAPTSTARAAWPGAPRRPSPRTASVPRDNNYLLDGVDNNETWLQTVVIFPSVDALDEFKLQTSTYSAEFGRSMGGVVNLQIKSGNNDFHGSAFEFHRNDRLDANNWFNNRAGRRQARVQAEPVRRHPRRPDHQGQDVLLRRLPGDADQPGPDLPLHHALGGHAAGQLLGDQPATSTIPLTGQPFPGNIIPQRPLGPRCGERPQRPHPRAEHAGLAQRPRPDTSTTT